MAGMFDNRIVLEIQQANDIVDVISEHVSLKKKGREMVGLCPFHDDHKPSMNVNSVKQIFKCFACGAGGDVFKFVQMRENLSFPQSIERLAERAGIKIRTNYKATAASNRSKAVQSEHPEVDPNQLARANAWAVKYFQKNLQDKNNGAYALDYLTKRKINSESIKKWQLGLAVNSPNNLIEAAISGKVPLKLLEQAGLISGQKMDKFVNRLMFTITDVTRRIIGFGGRTLDETGAKYINSPATVLFDKSSSLYGLEQARHDIVSSGTAVVVEGYTDCIMAHQFDCKNVVATLGTSFTTGHGRILRRYAKKVILIFDNDVAGIEAANRALDVCLSQRIDIKVASVPEGKDPCDFLLVAGKEGFERLLSEAVDVFQYKWDRLKEKFTNEDTTEGKRIAIEEYLQAIATGFHAGNANVLEFGLRINQISKIIGLESKQINKDLNRRIRQLENASSRQANKQPVKSVDYGHGRYAVAQREILEVLLNKPELYEIVRQNITADVFDVPIFEQVAVFLFEMLNNSINISLKEMLAGTESVELGKCLSELAEAGDKKGNYEPRLTGALEMLKQNSQQKQNKLNKTTEQQNEQLLRIYKNKGKENPYSVGMV